MWGGRVTVIWIAFVPWQDRPYRWSVMLHSGARGWLYCAAESTRTQVSRTQENDDDEVAHATGSNGLYPRVSIAWAHHEMLQALRRTKWRKVVPIEEKAVRWKMTYSRKVKDDVWTPTMSDSQPVGRRENCHKNAHETHSWDLFAGNWDYDEFWRFCTAGK